MSFFKTTNINRIIYWLIPIILMVGVIVYGVSHYSSKKHAYNVILISLDTLRADRLGCYGYDKDTSPSIDAFANKSILFENAFAPSSWTLASHMSMFTGLAPNSHGCDRQGRVLNPSIPTVTEMLKERGYRTYANTAGGYVKGVHGFNRGFEIYKMDRNEPFRDKLNEAQNWIKKLDEGEKFFMFLHTYQIHCPYYPLELDYKEMYQPESLIGYMDVENKCWINFYKDVTLSQNQVRYVSNEYDATIKEVDDDLGPFLKFLEENQLYDNTIVILTSDHGEEFHEHGDIAHDKTLYVESIKVPLIISVPKVLAKTLSNYVTITSIAPTIMDALNIQYSGLDAASLFGLLTDEEIDIQRINAPIFGELDRPRGSARSVIYKRHHLIYNLLTGDYELYDLREDPLEQHNILRKSKEKFEEYAHMLSKYMMSEKFVANPGRVMLQKKDHEDLKALGYL